MPDTRKRHDIHVSSAILGADLTPGEKMVYIAIRSRQGANDWCFASQRKLAADINCNKSHINRSIKTLTDRGWVVQSEDKRRLKCLDEPTSTSDSTPETTSETDPEGVRNLRTERTQSSTACTQSSNAGVRNEATAVRNEAPRTESQHLKPTMKANTIKTVEDAFAPPPLAPGHHFREGSKIGDFDTTAFFTTPSDPTELRYGEDDWQHLFAQAAFQYLKDADALVPSIRKKAERDPTGLMDDWADTFRLLHEQDEYSIDEIQQTMSWLLSPDSWWMQTGNFNSVNALRRKTSGGTKTKFDSMYFQAKSDRSNGRNNRPLNRDEAEELYNELLSAVPA